MNNFLVSNESTIENEKLNVSKTSQSLLQLKFFLCKIHLICSSTKELAEDTHGAGDSYPFVSLEKTSETGDVSASACHLTRDKATRKIISNVKELSFEKRKPLCRDKNIL